MGIRVLDSVDTHWMTQMLYSWEKIFIAFTMLTTLIRILNSLDLLFVSKVGDDFASDSQFLVVLHFGVDIYFFDIFLLLLQKQHGYVVLTDRDLLQIEVEPLLLDLLVIDWVDVLRH